MGHITSVPLQDMWLSNCGAAGRGASRARAEWGVRLRVLRKVITQAMTESSAASRLTRAVRCCSFVLRLMRAMVGWAAGRWADEDG